MCASARYGPASRTRPPTRGWPHSPERVGRDAERRSCRTAARAAAHPEVTARRRTLEAAAAQERVIAALRATGDLRVADRLQRCMEAMTTRRNGAGWPWACWTSGGCAWCGATIKRRWWAGMRRWIMEEGAPVSLAVLPLPDHPAGLRASVARLRRALRDVRDRAARRSASWRGVALAGMSTGDGSAFVLVRHPGIARRGVVDILRKRWPEVAVVEADALEPSWSMSTQDAAELARIRRGVEPLRIVALPQRAADTAALDIIGVNRVPVAVEPMPMVF